MIDSAWVWIVSFGYFSHKPADSYSQSLPYGVMSVVWRSHRHTPEPIPGGTGGLTYLMAAHGRTLTGDRI